MSNNQVFRNFGDVTRHLAATQPDRVALTFEGRDTTYGEFERYTNRVAAALLASGVKKGERVAYFGKNSDRYLEIFFGAAKVGAVTTPINWRLAGPELAYILQDSRAPILFVGEEFGDTVEQVAGDCPCLKTIVDMDTRGNRPVFREWRDAQAETAPASDVGRDDDVLQLYTSGTTGRPKGAMLMARNLLDLQDMVHRIDGEWARWSPDDISLIAMPIGHIGGTGWAFWTLFHGAKGIVVRDFDPNRVLDFIEHDKVNKLFIVPSALQIVVSQPRARRIDYSHLKYICYGASPIPLALLRECVEVFGCGFVQMYGMTETTGTVVALPPEDHSLEGSKRMRSAGKPLPGVDLAILDVSGRHLPPEEVGEIAIRSPSNMRGYWNLPEATSKAIDKDGWLRTGDAGYLDADGYLYIHDRVKDMIISGGENVYPAEVENAIHGHPDVFDVAVIGVPSEKWGEEVKAIVQPKPGSRPDPQDVIRWARERVAAFKAPKSVEFIDAFPRTATGKILRRELREKYWHGRDRKVN